MVGVGGEKLSKLRVWTRVDSLRRSHCRYGPGFAPDRLSDGALRPELSSAGMDYRQQRFLVREPDPHPPGNRPDPRVDRLASDSGPPNEGRRASRDHITRDDLGQVNLPRQEATLLWTAAALGLFEELGWRGFALPGLQRQATRTPPSWAKSQYGEPPTASIPRPATHRRNPTRNVS